MDNMQQKLDSILADPDMMQKIMSLARSIGQPPQEQLAQPKPKLPAFDPALLQDLAGAMQQSGIDGNQQALLNALCPYLSRERIGKLERAMQAAKLARVATTLLGNGLFGMGR